MTNKANIIIMLADDMGFSDIGCFGSEIYTPCLDTMAEKGIRYSHMYNNARCCPSRASLLTGLYPHQAGIGLMMENLGVQEYQGYLNDRCITLAEGVKAKGYQTGMIGKWHVGGGYAKTREALEKAGREGYPTPMQRGFDYFYGTLEGAGNYYNPVTLMENGKWIDIKPEDDFYYTEKIGEKACRTLERFAEDEKPFFLYVSFNAPHWPLHAREQDIASYEGKYMSGWDEIRKSRYRKQVEMGIVKDIWNISPRDSGAPAWDDVPDKKWEDIKMAVYAAQVEEMDRAVGRIQSKLEQLGIADDTFVLFTSDNGACAEELPQDGWILQYASEKTLDGKPIEVGNDTRRRPGGEDTYMSYGLPWANASNTPFRLFKHWIQEGGIAAPCVVSWGKHIENPGRIVDTPIHFVDIMPTVLDLAEAEYPYSRNGKTIYPPAGESFLPRLWTEWKREKPIFWEHEGNCGVRIGKYKLVRCYPEDFALYDMETDRTELTDISEQFPEIRRQMIQAYAEWAKDTGVRDWQEILEIIKKMNAK